MEMRCIPLPEQLLAYSQTRIAVSRLERLQQMGMVRQMKLKRLQGLFISKNFLHRRDISWIRQYAV